MFACFLLLVPTADIANAERSETVVSNAIVSPAPMQWHPVTIRWTGPEASEADEPSPFVTYELNVTFTHPATGQALTVPGFFAADGNAAHTGADRGDQWQARFAPPETGRWEYEASLTKRTQPVELRGASGSFDVVATTAPKTDFRHHGTLRPSDDRYLRFAGSDEIFLAAGTNSPETMLGYHDFDNTRLDTETHPIPAPAAPISLPSLDAGLHRFEPHVGDWTAGDPTWADGRGKGLIGGLNYLASQGVNSQYFLTMNVNADGRNVWPWTDPWDPTRFDVSKLDQWNIVFDHMQSLGIQMHVVLQEVENDHLLDGGELGPDRRRYFREMVARFAHHSAVLWNLGEENIQTVPQQQAMADYLRSIDAYGHPIALHNDHYAATNIRETYGPLLGKRIIDATTIQDFDWNDAHRQAGEWVEKSEAANQPWAVMTTEMGGANYGLPPDSDDPTHDVARKKGLWGNLMAGGSGVEWYFGWQNNSPTSDLSAESWRSRAEMYRQSKLAIDFCRTQLSLGKLKPADTLTYAADDYVLADPGETYAIYLPNGGGTRLDVGDATGPFVVSWWDPQAGGDLRPGAEFFGPSLQHTGAPPTDDGRDWVCLVQRVEPVFQADQDGRIVIEAEHFETQSLDAVRSWRKLRKSIPQPNLKGRGDDRVWVRSNLSAAFRASGHTQFVRLLPDTRVTHDDELIGGENFSNEPGQMAILSYRVRFDQPGRYHVWTRAFCTGTEDNSLHVGLNNTWPEHGQRVQWCDGKMDWTWSDAQRTEANHCGESGEIFLDVETAGVHTFCVSMREDGIGVDQFVLTRDADFTPRGRLRTERIRPRK